MKKSRIQDSKLMLVSLLKTRQQRLGKLNWTEEPLVCAATLAPVTRSFSSSKWMESWGTHYLSCRSNSMPYIILPTRVVYRPWASPDESSQALPKYLYYLLFSANFHALRHISSTVWVASQFRSRFAFSASAQKAGKSPSRRGPMT